jgi:dCTP deaminase
MPPNVVGVCFGKSTYARVGVVVNITPLEPRWRGVLTIGISNTTPVPARIYANEGIAQVLFFESEDAPAATYEGRKYQDQAGIVPPRIE